MTLAWNSPYFEALILSRFRTTQVTKMHFTHAWIFLTGWRTRRGLFWKNLLVKFKSTHPLEKIVLMMTSLNMTISIVKNYDRLWALCYDNAKSCTAEAALHIVTVTMREKKSCSWIYEFCFGTNLFTFYAFSISTIIYKLLFNITR